MKIILLFVFLSCAYADGDCLGIPGERIHASDLAARMEVFGKVSADVEIGFTPLPGGRRILTTSELRRALERNGVGSEEAANAIRTDTCVQMLTRLLDEQEVKDAIAAELKNQNIENATIEVLDFSRYPVPEGKVQFLASGLTPPSQQNAAQQPVLWRGRLNYGASRSVPIWARVRLFAERDLVIAANEIASGAAIAGNDLLVERRRIFPTGKFYADGLEQVVGKRAKRTLKKGDPITTGILEIPKDVERGDKVNVAVSSGAAQLRLDAIAESSGQTGERVLIRNPITGKRFQAMVESKGHVTVTALAGEKK